MTVVSSIVEEKSARYNFIKNFYRFRGRTKRSMLHTRWAHPLAHYCISGRYNDSHNKTKRDMCTQNTNFSLFTQSRSHLVDLP
jgi:hypothetical protein